MTFTGCLSDDRFQGGSLLVVSASYFESGDEQDRLFHFKIGERVIGDGDRRHGELAPRGWNGLEET